MGEKALSIVKQAIDIALAEGVYKSTQDVVLIHNAVLELKTLVDNNNKMSECEKIDKPTLEPKKGK